MEQSSQVQIVKILPTKIWIESDMFGGRIVCMQHDGCEPFDYARFNYDYRYTSNSSTWERAKELALALGATEPVEQKSRDLKFPTRQEIEKEIAAMQTMLADMPL